MAAHLARRVTTGWMLCAAAWGCGGSRAAENAPPPGYLLDPQHTPHPECPPEHFIVGVGRSAQGPDEARSRALAEVSNQVSLHVQSELTDLTRATRVDRKATTENVVTRNVQLQSKFQYGQFIQVVGGTPHYGKEWFALACLSRVDTVREIIRDLMPSLATFHAAQQKAQEARAKGSRAEFTGRFNEAWGAAQKCLPLLSQASAINRHSDAAVDENRRAFETELQALFQAATELRSGVRFVVVPLTTGIPEDLSRRLGERVATAFSRLGFPSSVAAENGCADTAQGVYAVQLKAAPNCRWGSLGNTCEPQVSVEAVDCASKRTAVTSAFAGTLRGANPRSDEKALRAAFEGLQDDAVTEWLRQALSSEIPLQNP